MSNEVTTKSKEVQNVRVALEKMAPQFQMVLPKHITTDRLMRVAITAVQNTPKLLDCDRQSLYASIMKSAQLGLEPDGILGQAYLIPFWNGRTKRNEVQFIPGYKGLIDLARRSGEVSNIIAKEVYENDEFNVDYSLDMPFVHRPLLSSDRGEVVHFWALARFKDGGFHWDYMTREEVEAIRDNSANYKHAKNKQSTVWGQHFVEMGKKTVIRRIFKYLPVSVQKAAIIDEMAERGIETKIDDYGEVVIEGSAEEVEEAETLPKPEEKSKLDDFVDENEEETTENQPSNEEEKQEEKAFYHMPDDMSKENVTAAANRARNLLKCAEGIEDSVQLAVMFRDAGGKDFLEKLGNGGQATLVNKVRALMGMS